MKTKKPTRLLSALLAIMMIITIIPMGTFTLKASAVTLSSLKSNFPQGSYWNHEGTDYSTYNNNRSYYNLRSTWTPCNHNKYGNSHCSYSNFNYSGKCGCNSHNGSTQCMGFARFVCYSLFGTTPDGNGNAGNGYSSTSIDNLRPGDYIRYRRNSSHYGHSVVVSNVSAYSVTVLECNHDGKCGISWTREIKKSELKGYYYVKCLTAGGVTPPTPTPEPTPPTPSYSTGMYRVTGCTGSGLLNIRNSPNGVYAGVQAHQGDMLRITDTSGAWGKMEKGWVCLNYCTRTGNLEPEIKVPAALSLSLSTPVDHATGTRITVTWPAASDATCYDVYLKNSSGVTCQKVTGTTARSADFMVCDKDAGTYTITAYSRNTKYTSGVSNTITVRAHAPSTVTFVDFNGNVLSKQSIKYGANAVVPPSPSRYGFTFSGWSGTYTNVKSNQTVTAQYTRNKYTVKFFNEDGQLIDTQKVYYEYAATAPSYNPNSGYDFVSWDKSFNYITGDTNITAVVKWYNDDMTVTVTDLNAVRDTDGTGVTVTYKVSNQKDRITSARAIVALKTAEGKLVTTTESAAFAIKNNVTKSQEVFVPTSEAASQAEVYIVANYKTAVPVSINVSAQIDQGRDWSNWSTTQPTTGSTKTLYHYYRYTNAQGTSSYTISGTGHDLYEECTLDYQLTETVSGHDDWYRIWDDYGKYKIVFPCDDFEIVVSYSDTYSVENRTEYRYRDKKFTTSSSSSLTGWTLYDTTWVWGNYGNWSGWTDSYIASSDSRQVETRRVEVSSGYYQYRYGRLRSSAGSHWTFCNHAYKRYAASTYYEDWTGWSSTRYYDSDGDTDWICAYDGEFYTYRVNGTDYYWEQSRYIEPTYKTQYRYRDRSKVYTYHFWQWGDWSDWGTTAYTAGSNREVETRTTYRYRTNETEGIENNNGIIRTVSGSVSTDYAGKDALLLVYKVDEASDYSNQFVKQLKIGVDGSYSATFKLLAEPTVESGDYTVTLGIAGTNEAIYVDTIEAPKPEYTVTFYDDPDNGNVIDTQTVTKGENAIIPEAPEKEGYHFEYWDSTGTNVKDNLDICAHYEINIYTVVFVNWTEESVTVQTYEHGQPIAPPEMNDTDSSKAISWEGMVEGPVTQNMIITAKYETKTFNVRFIDWDNNLISAQTVEYGQSAEIPEDLIKDDYVFFNWTSDNSYTYVTEDVEVVPVYWFEETVATPEVNIENGDYDSEQTVSITCSTENSIIYYTTDGSDPNNSEGAFEYTEPITIDRTCELRVIATAFHMNNSYEETRYIAINTDHMTSDWVSFSQVPDYVLGNLNAYEMITETGYRYKNLTAVTTIENAENLESNGWSSENCTFGNWSGWIIDQDPRTDGTIEGLIDSEVEEKDPDPEDVIKYQYSRWKYTEDGEIKYSRTAIDGIEGEWEYITLSNRLTISSYDGAPAFTYEGGTWYNQTYVTVQEVPDYKLYRYRSKTVTYSKWTLWTIDAPSADETREYESGDVYKYTAPERYVVQLNTSNNADSAITETFFNDANKKLQKTTSDFEIEGYTFNGAFKDAEYTDAWDFDNDIVDDSMTLYLKWTPKTYTVTFVGFDDEIVDTQEVTFLEYADVPDFEEVTGYVFCGLDTDSLLVTGDMTVRANYVKEEDYVKLSLNRSNYALYTGSSFDLVATVTPETAENKDVIWTSSDESVAYVDDMGKVTAVSAGTATIYATCYVTGYTEECTVTVSKNVNECIVLASNATCGFDEAGQLRGIKPDNNTVAYVKKQFANTGLVFKDKDGNTLGDDDLVGTGTTIVLLSGYTKMDEIIVVITGDMNGDGKVNNRDVSMGTRYLVEKEAFDLCQVTAFDVNGDGKTNNRDASMISRYLVGKETI